MTSHVPEGLVRETLESVALARTPATPDNVMRMISRSLGFVLALALLVLPAVGALGHSGGTNAAGCHTNRRTGGYHCHTPRTPPAGRVNYCHVVNGEYRCGYALSTCSNLTTKFGGYCVRQ